MSWLLHNGDKRRTQTVVGRASCRLTYRGFIATAYDVMKGDSKRSIRLGLTQLNVTVGDIDGNENKIIAAIDRSRSLGVDLLAIPELSLVGYPP